MTSNINLEKFLPARIIRVSTRPKQINQKNYFEEQLDSYKKLNKFFIVSKTRNINETNSKVKVRIIEPFVNPITFEEYNLGEIVFIQRQLFKKLVSSNFIEEVENGW